MLEAKKSKLFERIFAIYNRNLLKRRFEAFHVAGLDTLTKKNSKLPCILFLNHSSWWDGLVAFEISRVCELDSFVMMEEKHLRRLFLFRRLGAFSVIRENPFAAIKSIEYAAKLLQEKDSRCLWIFPQGEIFPNDVRPLKFYRGIIKLIRKAGKCLLIPVAVRYEFLGKFKPEIFVKIGNVEIVKAEEKIKIQILEKRVTVLLDQISVDIVNNNLKHYHNII